MAHSGISVHDRADAVAKRSSLRQASRPLKDDRDRPTSTIDSYVAERRLLPRFLLVVLLLYDRGAITRLESRDIGLCFIGCNDYGRRALLGLFV